MFEYKDADFYSEYFRAHPDFELIECFNISDDKEEKNLYVGQIKLKNTVHPLIIRVEIPFTFPHNKLIFRTTSLSGYPHLIHNGKIKYGDWFCLNTPFAETAEEQLNQEILRLKEWTKRQMSPNLPPIIKDINVCNALAIANAYEWENPDEVSEFSAKAQLTFVGDGFNSLTSFKEKHGFFHCVSSPDNRLYAFPHDIPGGNYKLPYIIVNEFPKNIEILEDFLRLKDFYNWDEKLCKHILPQSHYKAGSRYCVSHSNKYEVSYTESEALSLIAKVKDELGKDISFLKLEKSITFLNDLQGIFNKEESDLKKVPFKHKQLILKELERCETKVISNKGIKYQTNPSCLAIGSPEFNEYSQEVAIDMEWLEWGRYERDYFVIGFENNEQIHWMLMNTNPVSLKTETTSYDIEVETIHIHHTISLPLYRNKPQKISKKMFFGRGCLKSAITDKKIALIGLGAIGSMVAEIFAHGGVSEVGLWDNDIVEPGNICRAAFHLSDMGNSKVEAVANKFKSINPFINLQGIKQHGGWFGTDPNDMNYINGSFYGNINYNGQEEALKEIKEYDMIIDCTGSNEMLHFLSYALKDKKIISLCITNHSNELVCVSNSNGNPFELRKAYLSRIEQDTKNFYAEGEGCYSPTFLAKYPDISALINLCIKELDSELSDDKQFHSAIYSYCKSGILIDRINTLRLEGYDIILNIPDEVLLDAKEIESPIDGNLGYIFGCYSADRKQIQITHIVPAETALEDLQDTYTTSKGIIDYIGDYAYSKFDSDSYSDEMLEILLAKAMDPTINTNNPLMALRTKSGDIVFYLLINNQLMPFK